MSDTPAPVNLGPKIAEIIDTAFDNGRPIVVAYVDGEGQPHLSFRGSAQVFSPDQCALWIREPEGGLVRSLGHKSKMTMMYRDSTSKTTYFIYGRARLETDPEISRRIYKKSPKAERDRDPEARGVAVIIDVDAVQGGTPDARVNMRRSGTD